MSAAACGHAAVAPSPVGPRPARAGCYIVDARFDSAGQRRLGDDGRVSGVHPDTVGLGDGPGRWQETVALMAARSARDPADSLGPFYEVGPRHPYIWHVWQSRGDSTWVRYGTGLGGTTDILHGEGTELRGNRIYGTDTGAVYFATVRYRPTACSGS